MRFGLIVAPTTLPDLRPAPGTLDSDLVRARLPQPDVAIEVVEIDPTVDVAEQIDAFFEAHPEGVDAILFYASTFVALAPDGEVFLCLDPTNPDVGDSLRDVSAALRDKHAGPLLFVLDCRHAPDDDDAFRSATIVGAVRTALDSSKTGIELLVAAQQAPAVAEDAASPFTRSFLAELDETDPSRVLLADDLYRRIHGSERLLGVVPCFAHIKGREPFVLVAGDGSGRAASMIDAGELADSRRGSDARAALASRPGFDSAPAFEAGAETIPAPAPPMRDADDEAPAASAEGATAAIAGGAVGQGAPAIRDAMRERPRSAPPNDSGVLVPRAPGLADLAALVDGSDGAGKGPSPAEPSAEGGAQASPPRDTQVDEEMLGRAAGSAIAASEAGTEPREIADEPSVDVDMEAPPLAPQGAPPPPSEAPAAVIASAIRVSDRPPPADPASLPKIVISDRPPPKPLSEAPKAPAEPSGGEAGEGAIDAPKAQEAQEPAPQTAAAAPAEPEATKEPEPPAEPEPPSYADHLWQGDSLAARDAEGALAEYKKALLLVTPAQKEERADVYVRIGQVKLLQDKRREAISNFEKATQLSPNHRPALEEIAKLSVEERDWRGVALTEEKILATVTKPEDRFARLMEFGDRWATVAFDTERAHAAFARAREIRPDDLDLLEKLLRIKEANQAHEEAFALRVEIADKTPDGPPRAERYAQLARFCLEQQKDEEAALAFFEKALDADPRMLEPLATAAELLAERQEWSELEATYRRMLARVDRIPEPEIRGRVRFELNRRLALLFRDHLEDPEAALRALEKAIADKPEDLVTRQAAVALARELGRWDTARTHLQRCARIDPMVVQTYHDLFDVFQKLKRPDQAWLAASVTSQLGHAEEREHFIYQEGKTDGPPKPTRAMGLDGWDLLRDSGRDHAVEDVLEAIAKAAIEAKLGDLRAQGRLPTIDTALKQDPKKSTVSIVRSFAWASHLLGVPMPAVYLREDAQVGLAAVTAEEPSVIAGAGVLRGKTLTELAFAAGRHLGYHFGSHRLLLYFPVIDDLAACFLAAVRIVMPDASVSAKMEKAATAMQARIEPLLDAKARSALERAVLAFDAAGSRADLNAWVAAVERCSTRAGYLLANDLRTAATSLAAEGPGILTVEQKMVDLLWFTVSEEFHELRDALGIAIEP